MGKVPALGKHSKPHRSWGPYVTTGIALEAAAIFGFAYASDSHVSPPNLLAATIFVDGTKSITGSEEGVPFFRMANSFQSAYDLPGFDKVFIEYPRSLGPLTGQGDPTYDDSEADATAKIVTAVQQARKDDKTGKIYVVGYSQGSGAAAKALEELESEGFDTDNIEFVLAANPRRNDGGILTRLPKGVYLPVFGVTFGDGTSPERTDVLQVTKMYDGVGDSPDYIFSLVPPPDKWLSDVQSVGAGAAQTLQKLAAIGQPNPIVNKQVSTLAIESPNNSAPPVQTSAPNVNAVVADSPPPPVEDQKRDPSTEKPATGTGPNKVDPPQQPKGGWKPGDLLRRLFGPKPDAGGPTTATTGTGATDPPPAAPTGSPDAPPNPHERDSHQPDGAEADPAA